MSFCKNCGWMYSGKYCPKCGTEYTDESEMDTSEVTLSSEVTDDDREAEARRLLWNSMHAENVNLSECVNNAKGLKIYAPEDYYANFAIVACGGNDVDISRFLDRSSYMDLKIYADAVMDYMSSHMTTRLYCAVSNYMKRAQNAYELIEYDKIVESYIPESIRKNKEKKNAVKWFKHLWNLFVDNWMFVINSIIFSGNIVMLILAAAIWTYNMVTSAALCLIISAIPEGALAFFSFMINWVNHYGKRYCILAAIMMGLAVALFVVGLVFICKYNDLVYWLQL